MPYADNHRARLHWEECGEGSPLLLVMGHHFSSAMWYAARDVLAQKHRVITFDNRGTGASSRVHRIRVEHMAQDAFAVLDAARVESAHTYGISMGGAIALEMARRQPQRVRSLVLGATMAKTPGVTRMSPLLKALAHLPAPLVFRLMTRSRGERQHGSAATSDQIALVERFAAADVTRARTSVAQSRAINAYSIEESAVRAITAPALVLHGDEDELVPYAAGRRLHELVAGSEMVTLGGAAHNYFVARADEANAAVLEFVRRVDAHAAVSA